MGSDRSPYKDGEVVVDKATGKEAVVTDAGEFITHVQGEGDRYPTPKTNEQIEKR